MKPANAGSTRVRLFVAAPFAVGASLVLPDAAARHVRVLRLQPGAPVLLFNGQDGAEWSATVLRMTRSEVEVRLETATAVDRELRLEVTIALGMPANDRMDALVEKACELGVAAIQPLLCERSVLRLSGERGEARQRHWAGVAAAASEQCGRVRVADIRPVQALAAWLDLGTSAGTSPSPGTGTDTDTDTGTDTDTEATRIVLSLGAAATSVAAALGVAPAGNGRRRLVALSGPEGGLSADEEASAVRCGFIPVGLGPRVLRADTAPLALLAWLALHPLPTTNEIA